MKRKQAKLSPPSGWQLDPKTLKTEKVQYWRKGVMMTLFTKSHAQHLVETGRAFVISDQAIGLLENGMKQG